MSGGETLAFWLLAPLSVLGAMGMLLSRKAVHSAIWLALTMVVLAVFYMMQTALFLGFVQIIVYTGAVLMLFLFVLMLVGVDASDSLIETIRGQRAATVLAGLGVAVLLIGGISRVTFGPAAGLAEQDRVGVVEELSRLIFVRYVFGFEVLSALLITAALGAMVLAYRQRTEARPSQRALAEARFRGPRPSPLPAPGVYARHNAVDTPALLPDGSTAEESLSPTLRNRGVERSPEADLAATERADEEVYGTLREGSPTATRAVER